MKLFYILFCLINFNNIFSLDNEQINNSQDYEKCNQAGNNNPFQITTNTCTSVTSSLEESGDDKGQCCKLTGDWDILLTYKSVYHENWKKMVCQMYGVSENISEEELRKLIAPNNPNTKCELLTYKSKLMSLYTSALSTIDGKISYDCGDGESTLYAKDVYPRDEKEEIAKDIADCNFQYTEKNCYKEGSKLTSSLTQCCWCETIFLSQELSNSNSQVCMGFRSDIFEQSLNTMLNAMLNSYKNYNINLEYKCTCSNKNGNTMKGSFDTISGNVSVQ